MRWKAGRRSPRVERFALSGRRLLLLFALFLGGLAALTFAAMVALQTPFSGTRSETDAGAAALARLGAPARSWRTMVTAASVTRPVPIGQAWEALSRVAAVPLGTDARPLRVVAVTPGAEVVLCAEGDGDGACRLFRLHEAGPGRTTVVVAEARHGTATGLASPIVRSRLTRRLRELAVGLLDAAARGGAGGP